MPAGARSPGSLHSGGDWRYGWKRRGIFRRKPAPDLIRGAQRFAVKNATNARIWSVFPIPKEPKPL
jgi:hypothetical protein